MAGISTNVAVTIVNSNLAAKSASLVENLVTDRVASRLSGQDATLWGPTAETEAAIRLAWTSLHVTSRSLIGEIDALRHELQSEGIDRVVLAGMGGSSLAPEVITRNDNVALTVLDTTDPGQVADALAGDLSRTVLVVSSKSGGTVETDSHRRIFEQAFLENNIDPARRIVVVTDPGSPLAELAHTNNYRKVFLANPNVGGRYSALTAFGLVPAGLAGADIARLLDQAAAIAGALSTDYPDNPAIQLAAAFAAAHAEGAEKIAIATTPHGDGSELVGFGDWAEQLIAESTGKNGTGFLPVVVENTAAPGFSDNKADTTTVTVGPASDSNADIAVAGNGIPSLGAQFLLWEYAVAFAGRLLGINPFDQPDVEAAKHAARSLLDNPDSLQSNEKPAVSSDNLEIFLTGFDSSANSPADVLTEFLRTIPDHGYLAVQAYLDRLDDASVALLRPELAQRTQAQTTFGWGPRFLHSTGQYHKGGHQNGVFLQITGAVDDDLDVPGRPYTLGTLQHAQALGDAQVLAKHGRPVLRVHFTDRAAGLAQLMHLIQENIGD